MAGGRWPLAAGDDRFAIHRHGGLWRTRLARAPGARRCGGRNARHFLFLAGSRLRLREVALAGILLPVVLAVLATLFTMGFFDKFLLRFVEDKGSAQARIVMFELFDGFTWMELLFGPPQQNLNYFVHVHKLEFGIESLLGGFRALSRHYPERDVPDRIPVLPLRADGPVPARGWVVLGYFFLVNTTFLGIAGKSISVTSLSLMLLLFLPRRAPQIAPHQPALRIWRPEVAWRG